MMMARSLRISNAVATKGSRHIYFYLSILLSSAMTSMFVEAVKDNIVDPGADFSGYMQEMDRREREEMAYEAKLNAHEEWRQNTFGGWCVRQLQVGANHFKPFFFLIEDALRETSGGDNQNSSPTKVFMYIGVRMFIVMGVLWVIYVGAEVLQLFLGSDIEVVEEIVIVHEHTTEEEAAKARATTTRGKKQKSQ